MPMWSCASDGDGAITGADFVVHCSFNDNCRSEGNQRHSRNDPVLMQYHGKGRYPDGGPIQIVDLEDPSAWVKPEPVGGNEEVAEAEAVVQAKAALLTTPAEIATPVGKPILFTQPLVDMWMDAVSGATFAEEPASAEGLDGAAEARCAVISRQQGAGSQPDLRGLSDPPSSFIQHFLRKHLISLDCSLRSIDNGMLCNE